MTIPLFPRVHTVRVRAADASPATLATCAVTASPDAPAYVFYGAASANEVAHFRPTIWHFHAAGFERVRRGEYVSRTARRPFAAETVSIAAACERWHIQACPVPDLSALAVRLRAAAVYFDEQT